ncbi:UDP-glucuronosyltransferase 2C1-like isoform X2 [Tachysurus ichikawai]
MIACERFTLCFLLLLGLDQTLLSVTAGKILIWPGEFSHWLNIKVVMDELIARGHNLTIVTHSATPSVNTAQSQGYNVDIIQVPHTKQDVFNNLEKFMKYWMYDVQHDNIIQTSLKIYEILGKATEQNQVLCRELFAREDLLEKWRKEQFDVLLTDPISMCSDLLATKLNLPFIISLRFSFGSSIERLCGQLPTPASYVPAASLSYTDQMDFPQRMKNLVFNLFQDFLFTFLMALKWDPLYTELMEFSHWLNLKSIINELIARGHNVTVVTHSATPSVKTQRSPGYNADIVEVPFTKQEIIDTLNSMLKYWMYDLPNVNVKKILDKSTEQYQVLCRELFAREDLLEKWRKEQFDVLLTDPLHMCGELLAQKLDLPFLISLRFSFGNVMERLCGQLPAPPSFVPAVGLSYTDHMNFPQRVKNFLFILSGH